MSLLATHLPGDGSTVLVHHQGRPAGTHHHPEVDYWSVLANERPVMQSSKTQIKECCSDFRWKLPNNFRYDICKVLSGAIDTISIGYRQLRSPLLHKHSSQAFSFGTKNSFFRIEDCVNLLWLGDLTRLSKKTETEERNPSQLLPYRFWAEVR